MQCKALVVDDEPLARVRLKALLEPYASELEVVGEASSGEQAVEKIRELDPDVVFLDIQMPDMDAFDVLKNIDEDDMPLIVFTTAYENFALRAYEENTVDYLLKPVDPERLKNTMEKLRRSFPSVDPQQAHSRRRGKPADACRLYLGPLPRNDQCARFLLAAYPGENW